MNIENGNLKGSALDLGAPGRILWKNSTEFKKWHNTLFNWVRYINTFDPSRVTIKDSPGGKGKYIPIEDLTRMMDEVFYGHWEAYDFKTKVVANEEVGDITVRFLNPVSGIWLRRPGAAAVLIKQRKVEGELTLPTDIDKKYLNAMETGHPALLSLCLSNAFRTIGNMFGRDLNRDNSKPVQDRTNSLARLFNKTNLSDKAFSKVLGMLEQAQAQEDQLELKDLKERVETLYKLTPEQRAVWEEWTEPVLLTEKTKADGTAE
jgi:hypothetical protein